MKKITIKELYELLTKKTLKDNEEMIINGLIKTNRDNKNFGFLTLSDGSCIKQLQIVYKKELISNFDEVLSIRTGSAIMVEGKIVLTPKMQQPFELLATKIILLKQANEDFPLQKKKHTNEFLREIAHLRPQTNLFNSIMRIRSTLYYIINQYFQQHNYIWVSSPVITTNDAEGAGECFELAPLKKEEFFGIGTVLSVTGQLHLEAYAMAYQKVYTFGPQFRAEKSHTSRHAAEFWMLEVELSFVDLFVLMEMMENMFHYIIEQYIIHCKQEIDFLNEHVDSTLKQRLSSLTKNKIEKITYTQVIELLKTAVKKGINFDNNDIKWGMDLDSEHERYICEKIYNSPVFVYNYPSAIKAFYMKNNNDDTVCGVDLLVPGVGELCGGSERESNYQILMQKAKSANLDIQQLSWYLELRKYGYYKSSGFGLGFERLIMYLTGINNIRDVIPFPRTHGSIKF